MTTVRPKGDSVHSLVEVGWKQTKSCMAKCYIHANSRIDCSYKTVLYQESGLQTPAKSPNLALWCSAWPRGRGHVTEAQLNSDKLQQTWGQAALIKEELHTKSFFYALYT